MAIVEVSVVPLGKGTSVSDYVAGCLRVVREEKDIRYQVTPMGTVIEGDLDVVLGIIRKMHDQPFKAGAERVLTTIRVDDRRDRETTMAGKLASVERKLSSREILK